MNNIGTIWELVAFYTVVLLGVLLVAQWLDNRK